ncbi:MAG: type II secretion system major pseudopilin GspG [Tepidisphaeraceae bacterium]
MNRSIRTRRAAHSAFTLIELLLVLVILGVLAALVVPKFTNRSQQARETAAKSDITTVETALKAFEIDCGRFPSSEEGLGALLTAPTGVQGWKGPYIERGMPKDPWGNEYQYKFPGTQNPSGFDLFSTGPDGREGNDDIGNWNAK